MYFTQDDWVRIRRDWSAWWAGELARPLVIIESSGYFAASDTAPRFVPELPADLPVEQVIDRYQGRLEQVRYYGDAFPRWWPDFGAGVIAAFLGAKLHCRPETVWFEPSEQTNLADLRLSFDPDNYWWKRVLEITRAAAERFAGKAVVGFTDLGGNLDILASLRGTESLAMDLYDDPELMDRRVAEATGLWLRYYNELDAAIGLGQMGSSAWAPLWAPARHYMFQSDFAYMISPAMFERFVMPDLAALCDSVEYSFYHLDGKGQIPHLDMLLSLDKLKGIQWIPGDGSEPPEKWIDLLRRIRDGGKLCQLYVSAAGALEIIGELGGGGFAFAITDSLTETQTQEFLAAVSAATGKR